MASLHEAFYSAFNPNTPRIKIVNGSKATFINQRQDKIDVVKMYSGNVFFFYVSKHDKAGKGVTAA